MEEEEYNAIRDLFNERFHVPVFQRSRVQKNPVVKYWRLRKNLSLDPSGHLLYQGKRVLKKEEIKNIVAKSFKESKSGGYKKLRTWASDGYTGMSNRKIL